MTKNNFLTLGNATTIINTLALMCAGPIFGALVAHFGDLGITETDIAMVLGFIFAAAFAYINAKFHNSFWDRETDEITIPITVTDGTEEGINETIESLVEKYGANNTVNVEVKPIVTADDEVVDDNGC